MRATYDVNSDKKISLANSMALQLAVALQEKMIMLIIEIVIIMVHW